MQSGVTSPNGTPEDTDTVEVTGISAQAPIASIVVRERGGRAFYEAKFRHEGRQVKRRVGPAWLDRDQRTGTWRPRRGRVPEDSYDERRAHVAAAELVASYLKDSSERARVERERRARGVTFREVAHAYLAWLDDVKGAKPSTLADYGYLLAEPGVPAKRGQGVSSGHIMAALGDRPAAKVTTREIEAMLATVSATGVSARSVNKHRSVVCAMYNYGAKESTFSLPANPAGRRQAPGTPARLAVLLRTRGGRGARAGIRDGLHRDPARPAVSDQEREARPQRTARTPS